MIITLLKKTNDFGKQRVANSVFFNWRHQLPVYPTRMTLRKK